MKLIYGFLVGILVTLMITYGTEGEHQHDAYQCQQDNELACISAKGLASKICDCKVKCE